jgi:hypothetical protein
MGCALKLGRGGKGRITGREMRVRLPFQLRAEVPKLEGMSFLACKWTIHTETFWGTQVYGDVCGGFYNYVPDLSSLNALNG